MQAARNEFQRKLASPDGVRGMLAKMLETAGAPELFEADESGALTLTWDFMPGDADTDTQIAQYTEHLKGCLRPPRPISSLTSAWLESRAGLSRRDT